MKDAAKLHGPQMFVGTRPLTDGAIQIAIWPVCCPNDAVLADLTPAQARMIAANLLNACDEVDPVAS